MAGVRETWARLTSVRSNVDAIDEARAVLKEPQFAAMVASTDGPAAVGALRRRVRGLGLLDAVTLIRRERGEETERV